MATAPGTVIHVEKASLGFAAAHFNCRQGARELLHGHNYTVGVRVHGEVQPDGAIIDFSVLKSILREACDALDHHMIVPTLSPDLTIEDRADGHLTFRHRDGGRFVLPAEDCVLLDIANSTCECLAAHLLERLRERLGERDVVLEVSVEESPGQGARAIEAG